jgi:hypothetical protein
MHVLQHVVQFLRTVESDYNPFLYKVIQELFAGKGSPHIIYYAFNPDSSY